MTDVSGKSRLLVIAPHCDDEAISSAGLINHVLRQNGDVMIVIVTNGDGSRRSIIENYKIFKPHPNDYINLGYHRQLESIKAMEALGLNRGNVVFLGYPDGDMDTLWQKNWNADDPMMNFHTKTDYSPYNNSYTLNAPFTGSSVTTDMLSIIDDFRPTTIVYPHPNDQHQDHWATHLFVKYALAQSKLGSVDELLYLVHRDEWPAPFGHHPSSILNPPRSLINTNFHWSKFSLVHSGLSSKMGILESYKTQMKTMKRFLLSFDRENELFCQLPDMEMPSQILSTLTIQDPIGENLEKRVNSPANIENLVIKKDNNYLTIEMTLKGKVSNSYIYDAEIFLFYDSDKNPDRFIIRNKDNTTKTIRISPNLPGNYQQILSEAQSNSIVFSIPASTISEVHSIMLSTRTSRNNKSIDRTLWRLIRF